MSKPPKTKERTIVCDVCRESFTTFGTKTLRCKPCGDEARKMFNSYAGELFTDVLKILREQKAKSKAGNQPSNP